jgi:hypothetical protein
MTQKQKRNAFFSLVFNQKIMPRLNVVSSSSRAQGGSGHCDGRSVSSLKVTLLCTWSCMDKICAACSPCSRAALGFRPADDQGTACQGTDFTPSLQTDSSIDVFEYLKGYVHPNCNYGSICSSIYRIWMDHFIPCRENNLLSSLPWLWTWNLSYLKVIWRCIVWW